MKHLYAKLKSSVTAFLQDDSGGMMTLTAVLIPVIIGFSGLGMDMTYWYMQRRAAQTMADSGAIMGANALSASLTTDEVAAIVEEHLETQGFDSAIDTLDLTDPPSAGIAAGRNNFVEVIVSRNVTMIFTSFFMESQATVSARAVAGKVVVGEQCVVALDESAARALSFSGSSIVDAGCGVASNSSDAEAIYIGGSATLRADPAQAYGDIAVSGSGSLVTNSPVQSYSQRVEDPYGPSGRNLTIPPVEACDHTSRQNINADTTLQPGRYCGDISIRNGAVTFDPGVYILDGASLQITGGDLVGEGVTFILTADAPDDVGTVDVAGNASMEFSAPTEDDDEWQGILFFQDPAAPYAGMVNKFTGGSDMTLDGVLYFPNGGIEFTGGSEFDPSCIQVIGKQVSFTGSSSIRNDASVCESMELTSILQERVQLVE